MIFHLHLTTGIRTYSDIIFQHPDYINSGKLGFPNDLAIIELERDVDMNNSFVHPINLAASDNHSYVGETCYITGWGRMAGNYSSNNVRKTNQLESIDKQKVSQKKLPRLFRGSPIPQFTFQPLRPTATGYYFKGKQTDQYTNIDVISCLNPGYIGRDGGPLPDVLQEARIDVLEQRECVALWDQEVINDGHICVMERGEMGIGGCNVSTSSV